MTPRKGGLGRGLDAMISETAKNPRTSPKKQIQRKLRNRNFKKKKKKVQFLL